MGDPTTMPYETQSAWRWSPLLNMSTTGSKARFAVGMTRTAARLALSALTLLAFPVLAQRLSPASWTLTPSVSQIPPGGVFTAELRLKLTEPWHMYSLTTPKPGPTGGPTTTTIRLAENPAVAKWTVYYPAP